MNKITKKILSAAIASAVALSFTGFLSMDSNADGDCGYKLSGMAHVQDQGDTPGTFDSSTGILTLGTRGLSRRVEAISVKIDEAPEGLEGSIIYVVHVQDYGWLPDPEDYIYNKPYKENGEMAGTSGESKRLEAIKIELTGDLSYYYSVQYQVHIQDYGDAQGFVSDGALAGTTGESKRLEEVQIKLVKRDPANGSMSVNYRVHRQDYGWETSYAKDGADSGTTGQSKRLEGIEIFLSGNQYSGNISYRTHVQDYGWQKWCYDGAMSGTQGESKRLEAIQIELEGEVSDYYDIYYRVHSQDYGWLGWACNGAPAGTAGQSLRLEAIQIVLVEKGGSAPGSTDGAFKYKNEIAFDTLGISKGPEDNVYLGWYGVLKSGKDSTYKNVYSTTDYLDLYGEVSGGPGTISYYYSPDADFSAEELANPLATITDAGFSEFDWCLIRSNGQYKIVYWGDDFDNELNPEFENRDKSFLPSGYYKCVFTNSKLTAEATCYVM